MATTRTNTRPLGMVLVQQGVITTDELEAALVEQEEVGGLLGEVLIRRGLASRPHITSALAQQFGLDLEAQSGFGSGLRSQIQRHHETRRERQPAPAADDGRGSEQIEPPLEPGLVDPATERGTDEAPAADAANANGSSAPELPDGERIEELLTLVAERDAKIADLCREIEVASELGAVVEDERARNTDLAAAVAALERELGAEREADEEHAREVALLRGELAAMESELEQRPTPAAAAELEAVREAYTQRERELAALHEDLAGLRSALARRPGDERVAELEAACDRARHDNEQLAAALAARADELAAAQQRLAERPTHDDLTALERELEERRASQDALARALDESRDAVEALRLAGPETDEELARAHGELARAREELVQTRAADRAPALQAALDEERARTDALVIELSETCTTLADLRHAGAERDELLADAQAEIARLQDELERRPADETVRALERALDEERAHANERERALADAAEQHSARADQLSAELEVRHGELDQLRDVAATREIALAAAQQEVRQLESELLDRPTHEALARLRDACQERDDEAAELRDDLAAQRVSSGELAEALEAERLQLEAARDSAGRLEQELAAARELLAERAGELGLLDELRQGLVEATERERALAAERDQIRHGLEQRSDEAAELRAALAEQRARSEELSAEMAALSRAAAEREQSLTAVRDELARVKAELAAGGSVEKLAELEVALDEARAREHTVAAERDAERTRAGELAATLDGRRAELEALRRRAAELAAALHERPTDEAVASLREAVAERDAEAGALRDTLAEQRAHGEALAAALEEDRSQLERVRCELAELEPDREALDRLTVSLAEAEARERSLLAERDEERTVTAGLAGELETLRAANAELEQALATLRAEVGRLQADLAASPTGEQTAELQAALDDAGARERTVAAERDAGRIRASELATTLDARERELEALRRTDAERHVSLTAAHADITRLRGELDARPTTDSVAALQAALDDARERERVLAAERDESRSRADQLGGVLEELRRKDVERVRALAAAQDEAARLRTELFARPTADALAELDRLVDEQRARADELATALDRERVEVRDLRTGHTEYQETLAAARETAARLEGELRARPTADTMAELQAAVDGHRDRAAAREEELAAARERGRAREADLENALERQRAKAGELAAALYDERAALETLRSAEAERLEELATAARQLDEVRGALEKRPTDELVAQLRAAAAEERAVREGLADELAENRVRIGTLEARVAEHQQRAERFRAALQAVRDGAGELLWSFGFDVRGITDEAAGAVPALEAPDAPTEHLGAASNGADPAPPRP